MSEILLDAKLALEAELLKPLYRALSLYIRTWADNRGSIPMWDRSQHQGTVEALLLRHYTRVTFVMLGLPPPKDERLHEATGSLRRISNLRSTAHKQALFILASIDRELAGTLQTSLTADPSEQKDAGSILGGKITGYIGKIYATAKAVLAKVANRVPAMANVNTNGPAEESRFELMRDGKNTDGQVMKRWISLMDGRERDWHHEAHLDYANNPIPVDKPFTVGSELLLFPGDTSLGASLKNVVNCRCACSYVLVKPDGSEVEMSRTPHAPAKRQRRAGDRVGQQMPARATTRVTLNGRTQARVVLEDGSLANLRQETPSTVVITQNGKVVARADINGRTIANAQGREDAVSLIRRSVQEDTRN